MSIVFDHDVYCITILDSVGSFAAHRGWTWDVINYVDPRYTVQSGGNTAFAAAIVTFRNGAGGMTVHGDPLHPDFSSNAILQGRLGFTPEGQLIDAFHTNHRHDLAARTYVAEFGCAATTASNCTITSGAWAEGMPTVDTATAQAATPGTGYTYGCPTGNIDGGLHVNPLGPDLSLWLQKQEWLQKPGFENDPFRDWNLCDFIAHAPGKVVILCDLPGNNIFDATQHGGVIVDPFTGDWDPTGLLESTWNDQMVPTGDDGALHDIFSTCYRLRPDCEVIWYTPPNFPADDPRWTRQPSFVNRTQDDFGPQDPPADRIPAGHNLYSTADRYWDRFVTGIPQSFVLHTPQVFTPNPPDEGYLGQYDSPYNMPNMCQFPGGPTGTTLPFRINYNLVGFHRMVHAWTALQSTRSAGFQYLAEWWAHYIADQSFTQRHHGEPSGIFLGIGATFNWHVDNDRWGGFGLTLPLFPNRTWSGIYGQVKPWLTDLGTIVNEIVFGGIGGFASFINFNQVVTVLTKDITATNMARTFRDQWIPRQEAAELYWRGQGKKFTSLYTCDAIDGGADACSFDPDVKVGAKEHFVEAVHPSSIGSAIWMTEVVRQLIDRSFTYSGGTWAADFAGRRDDTVTFTSERDRAFAGERTSVFAGITTKVPEEII